MYYLFPTASTPPCIIQELPFRMISSSGRLDWKEKDAFNRLYNHYYYQRHNQFWYQEAMKKLPILTQATSMLVCGEDLGMVPDCVPWVMDQLQILSLEIQRMPKNPKHEFGHDILHSGRKQARMQGGPAFQLHLPNVPRLECEG